MGERIVSGSEDGEIAFWKVGNTPDSNEWVWKKQGHDGAILSICVSGDKIFSSSKDKPIRVWDLDTGDNRSTGTDIILGHTAPIKLSPDERWIVSASDDGSLRVWDSETGRPFTLPQHMPFRILSIDFSRDGKLIACCGADDRVHTFLCPDMVQPADMWPDSFIRKVHGREYCPVDDQGILANAALESGGGYVLDPSGTSAGLTIAAVCGCPWGAGDCARPEERRAWYELGALCQGHCQGHSVALSPYAFRPIQNTSEIGNLFVSICSSHLFCTPSQSPFSFSLVFSFRCQDLIRRIW